MKSKMNVLGRVLSMILAVALTITTVFSGFSRKTLAAENKPTAYTVDSGKKKTVNLGSGDWKIVDNGNLDVASVEIQRGFLMWERNLVINGKKPGSTTVVVKKDNESKTFVINVSRVNGKKANHLYTPANNQFVLYDNGKQVGIVRTTKYNFDVNKMTVTAAYGDGKKVDIKITKRTILDRGGNVGDALIYGEGFYTGTEYDPVYYTISYPVTFNVNGKNVTVNFTDTMTFYDRENTCHYELNDDGIAFKLENKQSVVRHTVNFVNGTDVIGTVSVIDGQDAEYTGATPVKAETDYASYTFDKWVDADDKEADLTNIKSDKTVYAFFTEKIKQYTVKFLYEDGEVFSENKYSYNATITVPDVPEKQADVEFEYTDGAWSPEVSTVCKGNAEYKATYKAVKRQYKVIYSVNGRDTEKTFDALTSAEDVEKAAPEVPSDYEIDGKKYKFTGWDKEFEKVTKDIVYTALYDVTDIEYTVRFVNSDGTEISKQTLTYGQDIVKPSNPKYPGERDIYEYKFAGWDKEVSDVCTGDVTYTAVYDKSISIAFYKYNDEAASRKDLFDYEYITARDPKHFTKLGSTITVTNDFTGYENVIAMLEEAYKKGESDTIYGNNNEEFVKAFVKLTAEKAGVKEDAVDCWYVLKRESDGWHVDGGNLKDYTVKFVDYDDSIISENIYNANEVITVPSNPVRESDETYNYKFIGWDKEISREAVSDVVYKALYEAEYINYTVRFLNEDGSVISENTYHYGDDVAVPENPTKTADETYTYVFAGWDKEVTSVKGNVDYTAVFTDEYNSYLIRFLDEDGTVILSGAYHYGEDVAVPENPTKAADEKYTYVFAGWDKEVTSVTESVDYTAVYEASYIDYTVRFLNEDGSVISENTYHYGDDVAVPENPTKTADEKYTYTFAGWDKEVTSVTGDADYTAVFDKKAIKLPEVEGDEDKTPDNKPEVKPGDNSSDGNKPSTRPVRKPEVEADEDVATSDSNMTLYIAVLGLSAATLTVIMGRKKEQDI